MIRLLAIVLFFAAALSGKTAPAAETARAVPITFTLSAPDAVSVTVAGSFNKWDPTSHVLAGPDRSGSWTITLFLMPGRYEYLFLVNTADWIVDPRAPSVEDGLGGRNSVVLVGTE
ncbi:MAG: isoamylase early set domain-containing protein [Nitrospirota bacterium]|nr:isoamylase early set domain-containing protein [Nitrospirota bacterium]